MVQGDTGQVCKNYGNKGIVKSEDDILCQALNGL